MKDMPNLDYIVFHIPAFTSFIHIVKVLTASANVLFIATKITGAVISYAPCIRTVELVYVPYFYINRSRPTIFYHDPVSVLNSICGS